MMIFRPTDYAPAILFLRRKPIHNRHLVAFLQRAQPGELEVYVDDPAQPRAVMLRSDQLQGKDRRRDVDIDADNEESFRTLIGTLRGRSYFFTFHRQWMIPLLWERYEKVSLARSFYMKVTPADFVNGADRRLAENIREIRLADAKAVAAFPEGEPSLSKAFGYTAAKWRDGERALRLLGMFEAGQIAAWVQFWMGSGMCEVMNIRTHPDHCRKGYAKGLLSVALIAIFKNHEDAFFSTGDDNRASIALSRSVGFRRHSCTYYFTGEKR